MTKTGTILDYEGGPPTATAFNPNWTSAEHEKGVAYICPWEDPHAGFPEHSRRCARALDDAGLPTHLRSVDPSIQWHMHFEVSGADKIELRKQYDDLLTKSIKSYMVEVYQVVPDDALLQKLTTSRWLDPHQLEAINRLRIISCVFERDRVSEYTVKALNRVGQTWVANQKDKTMLVRSGVERVEVVPIPYFPDDPLLQLRGRSRRPGPVRFYHIGKWEPRKAHHEMFGAFLMAFEPGQAKLYFKTSTTAPRYANYGQTEEAKKAAAYPSSPEQSLHDWADDERVQRNGWTIERIKQNVHLIKRRVSPEQIRKLHELSDVYVSLSRGEGFDMPAYDATLAGNLLVYTPSGGPQDFQSGGIEVKASDSVRCHPFYMWDDAHYLDWDYPDAVDALRLARERIEASDANRWQFDTEVGEQFTAAAVGRKMRRLIEAVAESGSAFIEKRKRELEASRGS